MNKRAWKQKTKTTRARVALNPHEISPVPIIGDAAVATGRVLSGHLVPVLILDTSDRPDIAELIRVQRHLPPGDVVSSWGGRSSRARTILLLLEFSRPSELKLLLEFDIAEQGILVDSILDVRAVGLQSGTVGDRLIMTMDHDRMIVEVTATGFEPKWNQLLRRELTRHFRREGFAKRQADQATERTVAEWRWLQDFRIKH